MKTYDHVVSRIKKLLAMSQDVSSPYEAAIAAKRVNKLMAEYNLDMADLIRHELENDDNLVEADFEKKQTNCFAIWIQSLAVAIAKSLSCKVTFRRGTTHKKKLVFQGFEPDVIVANWLLGYCYETIERLAGLALKTRSNPHKLNGRSFSNAFKKGAGIEVEKHIKHIYREENPSQASNGKHLLVIKQDLIAKKFGAAAYRSGKNTRIDHDAYNQGVEAGKTISIQKVVGSDLASKVSGYIE